MGQKLSVARRGGGNPSPPQPPQPNQRLWPSLLPASFSSNTATSSGSKSKNRGSSRSASTKSSISIASRLSRSSRASRASRASTSGYWSDCGYMATPRPPAIPRDIESWGLIYAGPVHAWKYFARDFGFTDRPIGCRNRNCERDSVCLESAKATLNRKLKCFEIHRHNQETLQIPFGKCTDIQAKLEEGFLLNEVVAAMRAEILLLVMYLWDSLRYQAMFVLVDIEQKIVTGSVVWPYPNMSIMECMISTDKTQVVVLFYHLPTLNQPFQYDLGTFCTQTFELGETMITCNKSVRPYTAFDPRYKSSRIAIVNYSDDISGIKNSLVLYCLNSKKVVVTSPVKLSAIYVGGYFCLNFSTDGRFLVLQKISDNMNGMPCYADTYVFNADNLDLLKHYFTNLQKHSALCRSNYAPLFSCCGGRMCIISEEMCRHDTSQRQLEVSVYQLPSPLRLQEQCRISIHQAIGPKADVNTLPLPNKMKVFLSFTPLID